MIIETLLGLPFLAGTAIGIRHLRNMSSPQLEQMRSISTKLAEPKPSLSETAELVIELLRENKGWTQKRTHHNTWTHTHETGVQVVNRDGAYSLRIADDNGKYSEVPTSGEDRAALKGEVKAFNARERNREQEELRRALAKRILERDAGTLRPLLGESGADGSAVGPQGPKGNSGPAAPAGLLAYDHSTGTIFKTSESDSVKLSEALAARYGVAKPSTRGVHIYSSEGELIEVYS